MKEKLIKDFIVAICIMVPFVILVWAFMYFRLRKAFKKYGPIFVTHCEYDNWGLYLERADDKRTKYPYFSHYWELADADRLFTETDYRNGIMVNIFVLRDSGEIEIFDKYYFTEKAFIELVGIMPHVFQFRNKDKEL